jgi:hypothetical protein
VAAVKPVGEVEGASAENSSAISTSAAWTEGEGDAFARETSAGWPASKHSAAPRIAVVIRKKWLRGIRNRSACSRCDARAPARSGRTEARTTLRSFRICRLRSDAQGSSRLVRDDEDSFERQRPVGKELIRGIHHALTLSARKGPAPAAPRSRT